MKTTEEKNRMIAEFMGLDLEKNDFVFMPLSNKLVFDNSDYPIWATTWGNVDRTDRDDAGYIIPTEYHSSWNWLMPVAHKCMQNETIDHLHPYAFAEVCNTITRALSTCQIHFVYDAVVKTIEFINQSKTKSHD